MFCWTVANNLNSVRFDASLTHVAWTLTLRWRVLIGQYQVTWPYYTRKPHTRANRDKDIPGYRSSGKIHVSHWSIGDVLFTLFRPISPAFSFADVDTYVINETLRLIRPTSRVPVGGKSSVCLICMKYRIIILIIIIKRLGEILLSYIAHTSRTHTPLPLCGYGPGL